VSEPLLEALLTDLNRVVEGPVLDVHRVGFRGVDFRGKTRKLYESSPDGDDREYLNRLVIEDIFPEELARRDFMGFRFRTFTGRTYRYLLMPAYGLSLGMAIVLGLMVELLGGTPAWLRRRFGAPREASRESRWPLYARSTLMVLSFALLCNHLLHARGYGTWPPTSKPTEERALYWMITHLPDDARIVCNWFNADFVRSYSVWSGRPIPSIFAGNPRRSGLRINIRGAVEAAGLEVPDLTSTAEIVEYARRNPGSFYVLTTRYGPWLPIEREPEHFSLIAVFESQNEPTVTVRIFELTTNRHRVEPRT
jgi:hypothetical protein